MSINRVSFTIREFVNREVYVNASHLVENCIYASDMQSTFKRFEDFDVELWSQYDEETDTFTEVFEWWIVSSWLGRKLLEKDEIIIKTGNLTIWGRTTTGQHITMDSIIEDIYNEIH